MPPDADKNRARAASTGQLDVEYPVSLSSESSLNLKLNSRATSYELDDIDTGKRSNRYKLDGKYDSDSSLIVGPLVESDFEEEDAGFECVYKRVIMDFSYMEQPIKCYFTCQDKSLFMRNLSSNAKGRVYATKSITPTEEFTLYPQPDGSVVLQSTRNNHRFLCSDENGNVYSSQSYYSDMEKWHIIQAANEKNSNLTTGCYIASFNHPNRVLSCSFENGSTTINTTELTSDALNQVWNIEFGSGELCFISNKAKSQNRLANNNPMAMFSNNSSDSETKQQLRCDIGGKLSLSNNCKGWEAWRFNEIYDDSGDTGLVRITPFAHEQKFLCCDNTGYVYTDEQRELSTKWSVEKAPSGYSGVVIRSASNYQILKYDSRHDTLVTVLTTATGTGKIEDVTRGTQLVVFDESCVWELEPLHRNIYYIQGNDNNNSNRRIGTHPNNPNYLYISRFSMIKNQGEEWKIQPKPDDSSVVTIYSDRHRSYFASSSNGQVYMTSSSQTCIKEDIEWIIEERGNDNKTVLVSKTHRRMLVYNQSEREFGTVDSTTIYDNEDDNTNDMTYYWKLEPKVPRKINEEKMKALGVAISIGLATSLATPVIMGGAIGIIGITEVGVAGHAIMGSIRAAEAISSITRVTVSSTDLITTEQSSLLHQQLGSGNSNNEDDSNSSPTAKNGTSTSTRTRSMRKIEEKTRVSNNDSTRTMVRSSQNRPFCSWRTW